MTSILYWQHPTLTVWSDAYVVTTGNDGDGNWVELSETIAHVRGGGQMGDRGRLGNAQLLDVRRCRDTKRIKHYVDSNSAFREGMDIALEIDAAWRRQNSVLHSAGHLLAGVVEALYSEVKATNAHHYPGEARVDFTAPHDCEVNVSIVNAKIHDALKSNVPTSTFVHPDGMRYVKVGGYPSVGCGGTHVAAVGDISSLSITKIAQKKGALRISYSAT